MKNTGNNIKAGKFFWRPAWSALLIMGAAAVISIMWPCAYGGECHGGGSRGLALGAAAFLAVAVSTAYRLRKDLPGRGPFRLEQWLYSHVVIGVLALYLVTAHSGFRLGNKVAAIAFAFLAVTVISGVAGLFLFYFMPRTQARHESSVLLPDDLCRRLSRLHEEIAQLCSGKADAFLEVYNELVIPLYRAGPGKIPGTADVAPWADRAPAEDMESFAELAAKVEEVHDLMVMLGRHMRFRKWTQGWLLLHVPSTIGLVVFSLVHLITVLWYGVP